MILTTIRDFRRYLSLNSRFDAVAQLLGSGGHKTLAAGRHDIMGDDVYVISSPEAVTRPTAKLEAHRRYIDIHVPISREETIGVAPVSALSAVETPYDAHQDYVLYGETTFTPVRVMPEELLVLFPEDAHLALLGDGHLVHKCVFKVREG